jgi:hypothetical protein
MDEVACLCDHRARTCRVCAGVGNLVSIAASGNIHERADRRRSGEQSPETLSGNRPEWSRTRQRQALGGSRRGERVRFGSGTVSARQPPVPAPVEWAARIAAVERGVPKHVAARNACPGGQFPLGAQWAAGTGKSDAILSTSLLLRNAEATSDLSSDTAGRRVALP